MKRFRECLNVDIGGAGIESFTVPISLVLEMAYNTQFIVWMYIELIHLLLFLATVPMTRCLTSPEMGKESVGGREKGALREALGIKGVERVRAAIVDSVGLGQRRAVERVERRRRHQGWRCMSRESGQTVMILRPGGISRGHFYF